MGLQAEARRRARSLGAPAVWDLARSIEINELIYRLDPTGGLRADLDRVCARRSPRSPAGNWSEGAARWRIVSVASKSRQDVGRVVRTAYKVTVKNELRPFFPDTVFPLTPFFPAFRTLGSVWL